MQCIKKITINRVTETRGLFLQTATEIKEWVNCANDYGCDLFMSIGPRAVYDTSATNVLVLMISTLWNNLQM